MHNSLSTIIIAKNILNYWMRACAGKHKSFIWACNFYHYRFIMHVTHRLQLLVFSFFKRMSDVQRLRIMT